ncbi:MAG: NAD(P)/FAD-dependent oxidoreductase [Solirubrobacteraceae bacterium]|nr:NAD(P)/FAD-dependent oxidoreductase [Solirubrobacteraceae bacterium]
MSTANGTPHHHVVIVGCGFGGIAAAVRLREAGFADVAILEKADDVGGTWRENTYPGIACDVPSHLYSLSFAPNPAWSRTYSEGGEIWAYLRDVARRHGLYERTRFGCELLEAAWDEDARRWRLRTTQGPLTADAVVSATGPLHEPAIPDLPGLETFAGTAFHSARWDHGHDLAGRRVAVVGTGASAIQFVPRIQPRVAHLTVFQRTPPWVLPRTDRPLRPWEQRLYRAVPAAQRAMREAIFWARELLVVPFLHPRLAGWVERAARAHLARQVRDPQLRAKLTPGYRIGCKRILLSNDWYPALTRDNVEVVTDAIAEVRPHAIVTADGREHPVDTIVFGTGFHVTDLPIAERVVGRGGRRLADVWGGSPQAHLGTIVHGFPNLFLLLGPNTGLGHNSVVYMEEAQAGLVVAALRHLRATGAAALEPRPEAQAAYVAEMDARSRGTVWTSGGCRSWYLDATGRNSTLWPGSSFAFARRLARLRPEELALIPPPVAAPARAPAAARP